MACLTPKRIHVPDTEFYVYIPCGKCYECQNDTRAAWAFRAKYELQEHPNAFFITLTYDNEHLLSEGCVIQPLDKQKSYIDRVMCDKPINRKWDSCIFHREHMEKFLKNLQKEFKRYKYDFIYEKSFYFDKKGKKQYKDIVKPLFWGDNLIRYYATSEYGDFSHRPHHHALLFFPLKMRRVDVQMLCRHCWKFGNVDVGKDCRDAAINYVAKHQVKSCQGSALQRQLRPICKYVSRYNGGIGRSMINDASLYYDYCHTAPEYNAITNTYSDEFDKRVIRVQQGTQEFVVSMPRWLTKHFRERYARENNLTVNLEYDELRQLEKKSFENFFVNFETYRILHPEICSHDYDVQVQLYYTSMFYDDFKHRQDYEKARFAKKKSKLQLKYSLISNLENDEPI